MDGWMRQKIEFADAIIKTNILPLHMIIRRSFNGFYDFFSIKIKKAIFRTHQKLEIIQRNALYISNRSQIKAIKAITGVFRGGLDNLKKLAETN